MPVTKILSRKINVTGDYLSPGVIYKDYTCSYYCLSKHEFKCHMHNSISSFLMMLKNQKIERQGLK